MIDADESDLFDVLNYIAHTKHPLKRSERAGAHRASILLRHDAKQQAFLDFVLSQYVAEGEAELGMDKLPDLLDLNTARQATRCASWAASRQSETILGRSNAASMTP